MRLMHMFFSEDVRYRVLRGWQSVHIAPQPESMGNFLLLLLSLQCHILPPDVYSTVLNITNPSRYSKLPL